MSSTPEPAQAHLRSFMDAVADGDVARVREIAALAPAVVHQTDHEAFDAQPIVVAAWTGNLAMIDALLELGADINCRSHWWAGGFGVLHTFDQSIGDALIARGAAIDIHAAAALAKTGVLTDLLDANPSLVHARGGDGQTPLHFAANPEIAALLLDRDAEIDSRDIEHESTPAQWAASSRPDVCAFLVSRGAASDIFMGCAIGEAAIVEHHLASDPDVLDRRITETDFPCHGSESGHIYMSTLGRNASPIHVAARFDHPRITRTLLDHGADVNTVADYDDCTPLHVCAWTGSTDAARVLLEHGADMDRDSGALHRNAPLGWAIVAGRAAMVELLLDAGAAVRDHYIDDAEAGLRGDLRRLSAGTSEDYRHILDRLRASSG